MLHARSSSLTLVFFATVFAVAALIIGWAVGGQALLGRIDPALALPTIILPALLLAYLQRRSRFATRAATVILAIGGLLAGQAALMALLAPSGIVPVQLFVAGLGSVLACAVADLLWQRLPRRRIKILAALALASSWLVAVHLLLSALYSDRHDRASAPNVTMLTSLPLRWGGGGDLSEMLAEGAQSAPALAALERKFRVDLVDSLIEPRLTSGTVLLLAHPRALAPAELVAIDDFVRGGGRAVILADALSGWPIDHPLGDPRNPPITSLLTPLLDHWGIELASVAPGDAAPRITMLGDYRLALFSAGHFTKLPAQCRPVAARQIVQCSIGQGNVWVVGDADLLFAPLWSPVVSGAQHLRRSDNMTWLIDRVADPQTGNRLSLRPVWIRPDTPAT